MKFKLSIDPYNSLLELSDAGTVVIIGSSVGRLLDKLLSSSYVVGRYHDNRHGKHYIHSPLPDFEGNL